MKRKILNIINKFKCFFGFHEIVRGGIGIDGEIEVFCKNCYWVED